MTEMPDASALTPNDEVHDAPDADAPPATDASSPPRRKHRVLRRMGWGSAALGVLALIGLSAYLVDVSRQWSDRVDELTVISTDLGQRIADAESAQADAEARMVAAQAELENATLRISDLANEEAQANDRESVLIDYVDAMISCADSRQNLIDALTTPNSYFENGKSKAQVEREVTTYCDGVASD
ncbi:MAG: hypothetical protein CVT68_09735, partial [Actinobacteria bacterium HGW-Actinobacteria-8]